MNTGCGRQLGFTLLEMALVMALIALPSALAAAGIDTLHDPWDRPYVYLNSATASPSDVRKDRNLVPINTDFDLYSRGRNSVSPPALTAQASRDDIIRASNGAFLGAARAC